MPRHHRVQTITIRIIISVLCLSILNACNPSNHDVNNNMPSKNTIIFIPGYYGSELEKTSNNKKVWITAMQAIFGKKTMAIDESDLEIPNSEPYQVGGILKNVNLLFGLIKIDVYGNFLTELNSIPGYDVIPFSYDWRRDNIIAVKNLSLLVDKLKREKPDHKITIVAHSMGGLITSYYLRYGNQPYDTAIENWAGAKNIDKVVMAAVPFRGVMLVFRNMETGVKFGFNSQLMKPHAVASFGSSYQTLFLDEHDLLNNELKPFIGAHDAETWKAHQWGLLKNFTNASQKAMNNRFLFVDKALIGSRNFLNLINAPKTENIVENTSPNTTKESSLGIPLLYIHSNGHKTLEKMIVNDVGKTPRLIFNNEQLDEYHPNSNIRLFAEGDSTVTTVSSTLPLAFQINSGATTINLTTAEHSKIYNDTKTLEALQRFLRNQSQ